MADNNTASSAPEASASASASAGAVTSTAVASLLQQVANEPTVGLHYINEHIRQTVPTFAEQTSAMKEAVVSLKLGVADVDDANETVALLNNAVADSVTRMTRLAESATQNARRSTAAALKGKT